MRGGVANEIELELIQTLMAEKPLLWVVLVGKSACMLGYV